MKNFILIDFLVERVKNLFSLIEKTEDELKEHNHDSRYYRKEEIDIINNIKQNPNILSFDYRIKEGNNAVIAGDYEIAPGCVLEIPKGSTVTIV